MIQHTIPMQPLRPEAVTVVSCGDDNFTAPVWTGINMASKAVYKVEKYLDKCVESIVNQTYKNLETELEFKCEEGHSLFAPWKKIRTRRECPRCKDNKLKEKVLKP